MLPHKLKFAFAASAILLGLSFGPAPAVAGWCGYYGCGAGVVIVQPPPVVYPSCSCCGCGGASYLYTGYAPTYVYRPSYWHDVYANSGYYPPRYYGGYGRGFYGPRYYGGYAGRSYRARYYGGYRAGWRGR
jgi:hypothetical protein